MRKAIFTVLLNKYDELKPAPRFPGWDTILFTDHHYPNLKGWTIHKVKPQEDSARESRKYKFLSHQYLAQYNLVCYIDANMNLHTEPPSKPVWFAHPMRKDVKTEATRCIQLKKDDAHTIQRQLDFYKKEGFPDKSGLYQNGFFVREHSAEQNKLMEYTMQLLQQYSCRDQLAFPFAIWKTGITPPNILKNNEWRNFINIDRHLKRPVAQQRTGTINVHHITPGRADKNLGKAINSIISVLPDEDWICLRDIDTMPAYHLPFFQQCEDIAKQSSFSLVGCMTNRLGLRYQLHGGEFSENFDMKHHLQVGKQRFEEFGSHVEETKQTIAGLFMLFPKSAWKKVGGFPEGGIRINGSFVDFHFSEKIRNAGMRVGIAQGIYLVHTYRMWNETNPKRATAHLD